MRVFGAYRHDSEHRACWGNGRLLRIVVPDCSLKRRHTLVSQDNRLPRGKKAPKTKVLAAPCSKPETKPELLP
jgi:hypothetical protein